MTFWCQWDFIFFFFFWDFILKWSCKLQEGLYNSLNAYFILCFLVQCLAYGRCQIFVDRFIVRRETKRKNLSRTSFWVLDFWRSAVVLSTGCRLDCYLENLSTIPMVGSHTPVILLWLVWRRPLHQCFRYSLVMLMYRGGEELLNHKWLLLTEC